MKLYNDNMSPFASRVRIQVYHKELDVEIVPPPGGLGSDEYNSLTTLGTLPALDDGEWRLSESAAIMEYLEDLHPDTPMRPADPCERARTRMIIQYHDSRIQPQLGIIFHQLMQETPDRQSLDSSTEKLATAFARLEGVFGDGGFACGSTLSIADCVLVPTMYYYGSLAQMLALPSLLDERDTLAQWWSRAREKKAVDRVVEEIDSGCRAMLEKRGQK